VHYKEWEDLGQRVPEPHEANARCKDCFPADKLEARRLEAAVEASESEGGGEDSSEMGSVEEDDFDEEAAAEAEVATVVGGGP